MKNYPGVLQLEIYIHLELQISRTVKCWVQWHQNQWQRHHRCHFADGILSHDVRCSCLAGECWTSRKSNTFIYPAMRSMDSNSMLGSCRHHLYAYTLATHTFTCNQGIQDHRNLSKKDDKHGNGAFYQCHEARQFLQGSSLWSSHYLREIMNNSQN
jgi:hypothetical protein